MRATIAVVAVVMLGVGVMVVVVADMVAVGVERVGVAEVMAKMAGVVATGRAVHLDPFLWYVA